MFLCKTQHATLALAFGWLGKLNPSAVHPSAPANDARWGTQCHIPTSAPSALKPLPFALVPSDLGSLQCALSEAGRPRFFD